MAGISGIGQTYYGGQTADSINTLMSSLGTPTGVNSMANILTDYKTIQTGTYGKLLKAYYAQGEDTTKSKSSSGVTNKTSTDTQLQTSLADTRSKMESLNTSASKLAATGGDSLFNKKEVLLENGSTKTGYDIDSIYGAVSGFVGDYNKAYASASTSPYKTVSNGAESMASTTSVMAKQLERIGITTDEKGKLLLDEKTFRDSDMGKVKNLFNGNTGYAASIASTASRIAGTSNNKLSAMTSTYSYGKTGSYTPADVSSLFSGYM